MTNIQLIRRILRTVRGRIAPAAVLFIDSAIISNIPPVYQRDVAIHAAYFFKSAAGAYTRDWREAAEDAISLAYAHLQRLADRRDIAA